MALWRKILRVILIVLAAFIISAVCRTFCLELYTVAPRQMENTLLPGDRVLVEKWHYGMRLPHKRIAMKEVNRSDVVVYNYPIEKPLSQAKYPTAIARCIGLPGDTIEARDGNLYVNGVVSAQSPIVTAAYLVADSLLPQIEACMMQFGGRSCDVQKIGVGNNLLYLDRYTYNKLCDYLPSTHYPVPVQLSKDNYTIELPSYGRSVVITSDNASFYADIINKYEPKKVELQGNAIYRGGRKVSTYRFSQPYYWVLCDNRTAATDSRTFGVLPHSHVIGRCGAVIFSIDMQQTGFSSWRVSRFFQFGKL